MLVVCCQEHLDQVRDWARQHGLLEKLDAALFDLGEVADAPRGTPLVRGRFVFNGGLIYHGPDCPGDGSFPSLSVSLSGRTDARWEVHT